MKLHALKSIQKWPRCSFHSWTTPSATQSHWKDSHSVRINYVNDRNWHFVVVPSELLKMRKTQFHRKLERRCTLPFLINPYGFQFIYFKFILCNWEECSKQNTTGDNKLMISKIIPNLNNNLTSASSVWESSTAPCKSKKLHHTLKDLKCKTWPHTTPRREHRQNTDILIVPVFS